MYVRSSQVSITLNLLSKDTMNSFQFEYESGVSQPVSNDCQKNVKYSEGEQYLQYY